MDSDVNSSRSPAVIRAAAILMVLVREGRPLSSTAIAREVDLPRTSVLGICETLTRDRMLSQGADSSFWLGPLIAEIAAAARLAATRAIRIGLLIPSRENAYYSAFLRAADFDIRSAGGELTVQDAAEDGARQREQWQRLIDGDADVILIDAVDSRGFGELITQCRQRDIPVVAVGSRVDDVDVSVTSDNTQAGLLAGHALARRLRPGQSVAVIDGLRKSANADRVSGFLGALRDHPHLQVVARIDGGHDTREAGRAAFERLLIAHPDIAGVFTVCDPVALGVAGVIQERGLPALVTSVDGRRAAVSQIWEGGPIVATAAQDPVRIIRSALDTARTLNNGMVPQQRAVLLPVRLIDAENVTGYESWD